MASKYYSCFSLVYHFFLGCWLFLAFCEEIDECWENIRSPCRLSRNHSEYIVFDKVIDFSHDRFVPWVALLCCFPIDRLFAFLYGCGVTFICAKFAVFDSTRHSNHTCDGISKIKTWHMSAKKHCSISIHVFKRGWEEGGWIVRVILSTNGSSCADSTCIVSWSVIAPGVITVRCAVAGMIVPFMV